MERRIIIGMITSTDYLRQLIQVFESRLIESSALKKIAQWTIEYYEKYEHAPGRDIQDIYKDKLRKQEIPEDQGDFIEKHVLPSLNDEYIEEDWNVEYLLDQTYDYLEQRNLEELNEQVQIMLDKEKPADAQELINQYRPISKEISTDTDLSKETVLDKVERAFNEEYQSVVQYPGALGQFMNTQLVRTGFVAFQAPEKRGKTYWMLDMAIRAVRQKKKVAFIQAGDMTESEQLRRIATYLTKKSNMEDFTGYVYKPVKDCIYNILDICTNAERESDFGALEDSGYTEHDIRNEITFHELKEAFDNNPDYLPCHNCKEFYKNRWGIPWFEKVYISEVLQAKEAQEKIKEFFVDKNRQLKLSTHPSDTVTPEGINEMLKGWQQQDGFIPDLVIIDYADLLTTRGNMEFRHKQNHIWQQLRKINQQWHCLLVTATQADADSYDKDTISKKNFSEDKRKYSHVTAIYGLNQDKSGREKEIGILRINELMVREGGANLNQVTVLQRLQIGRPFITSYF